MTGEDVPKAVHPEAEPGLGSGSEAGALSSCFCGFVSFSSVGRKTNSRQTGGARVGVTGDPEERVEWLNRSPDKEAALKMLVILKLVEKLGALSSDVPF